MMLVLLCAVVYLPGLRSMLTVMLLCVLFALAVSVMRLSVVLLVSDGMLMLLLILVLAVLSLLLFVLLRRLLLVVLSLAYV